MGHLDDVLLVHHDPVRFRHQLKEDGVGVVAPFGVPVPFDVGAHHAAARHAGPDDRTRGDESEVVVDAELAHEHSHGGRFDVEAPHRQGLPEQVLDARVALEPRHVVDVDLGSDLGLVLGDEVDGVADFAQSPLAEDVEFVQSHVFRDDHVKLRRREAFGRHERPAEMVDGPIGDEDAAGVDGQGVWEVLEVAGVPHHEGFHVVGSGRQEFAVGDAVDVVFGQAEDLPQFPDDRAVLEGVVRPHQRHVGEPLEDVFRHVIPIGPREVDVEVRRIRAVQVDEPFEVQVEFDGVHVCDAQQVGDEAVGSASTSHVKVPAAARIAGDVPVDEEIGQIPLLSDDRQLHFHSFEDVFFVVRVAVSQPLGTQRPDELFVFVFRLGVGVLVVVRSAVRGVGQGDFACVEQRFGPLHPVGMLGERLVKIGGREQPVVRVAGGGFGQLAQQLVAVHGPQDAVAIPIAFVPECKGVQGDEPLVRHIGSAFE